MNSMSNKVTSYSLLLIVILYNLLITWAPFTYYWSDNNPLVEKNEFYTFVCNLPETGGKQILKTIFQIDFISLKSNASLYVSYSLLRIHGGYLPLLKKISESNYSHTGVSPPKAS